MEWIKLPRICANEDGALVHWNVPDGAAVHRGQVIATLETFKASMELEAAADGVLCQLVPDGGESLAGTVIGALVPGTNVCRADVEAALVREFGVSATSGSEAVQGMSEGRRWTKKASMAANAAGIAIEDVSGQGKVVEEADVLAYLAARQGQPPSRSKDYYFDDASHPPLLPQGRVRRILLLGDGIGAALVLDVMFRLEGLVPYGILDDDEAKIGRNIKGVTVLGPLGEARRLWVAGHYDGAVCLLQNRMDLRRRVFDELRAQGVPFVNIIDPSAIVHSGAQLGDGNIIQPFCRIGTESVIGDNNMLSAYVNIDHHSHLGSHCTFGPSVCTSGEVFIGESVRFGTGIRIEPRIRIGDHVIIGSGAVIVGDIPDYARVRPRINYQIIEGNR